MYLILSVLTVGTVLSFINNKTFVGKRGTGMKVLSLGDSFQKTEGKDSNLSSANKAGKRLSYHLDKWNEPWAALNLFHEGGFTYPALLLVDSKYKRS